MTEVQSKLRCLSYQLMRSDDPDRANLRLRIVRALPLGAEPPEFLAVGEVILPEDDSEAAALGQVIDVQLSGADYNPLFEPHRIMELIDQHWRPHLGKVADAYALLKGGVDQLFYAPARVFKIKRNLTTFSYVVLLEDPDGTREPEFVEEPPLLDDEVSSANVEFKH